MYLISVEGGDGSGKGEAVRILRELARSYPFPEVHLTHEPRRHSQIGALAMQAVKSGDKSSLEEAGLFAADRIDHSHTWIRPRLERGDLVISDRNVHSSLIYQGIIGKLGVEKVAAMNAGAMVPDLVIWIDCDPELAMKRIKRETLRSESKGRGEYFETLEIQTEIRRGFGEILSPDYSMPAPFNRCAIAGPIVNEGSKKELRAALSGALRGFLNRHPPANNVDQEIVDRHHLATLVTGMAKQKRLPGAPRQSTSLIEGWLAGSAPYVIMENADKSWDLKSARAADVPGRPLAHPVWSILGTLSFIGATEISRLREHLGPVRSVTQRHTQRMIKWFDAIEWTQRQQAHIPFSDAPLFKIREDWVALGRLWLALWPLLSELSSWRRRYPSAGWKKSLSEIVQKTGPNAGKKLSSALQRAVDATLDRLKLLTSGHIGCPAPTNVDELLVWWSTEPPAESDEK